MIRVSAGIIRDKTDRILVCRRGEGRANAHLWEFPGGKQEDGESEIDCLRRELREELSLAVEQPRIAAVAETDGIRFTFITCVTHGQPIRSEHEAVCFVRPREMLGLSFCPADQPIAHRLALTEPRIRAAFWDFDGTLFDTYPMMSEALSAACASLGFQLPAEAVLPLMKVSLGYALDRIASERGCPREALAAAYHREQQKTGPSDYRLTPGMEKALLELRERGCRHYLVTHRDGSALDALRSKALLGLFEDAATGTLGLPRKPDPAMMRYLLDRHGLEPETVCMVGDRPLDMQAGRQAGTLACLFDPEHRFDAEACDLRVRSAESIADAICPDPL